MREIYPPYVGYISIHRNVIKYTCLTINVDVIYDSEESCSIHVARKKYTEHDPNVSSSNVPEITLNVECISSLIIKGKQIHVTLKELKFSQRALLFLKGDVCRISISHCIFLMIYLVTRGKGPKYLDFTGQNFPVQGISCDIVHTAIHGICLGDTTSNLQCQLESTVVLKIMPGNRRTLCFSRDLTSTIIAMPPKDKARTVTSTCERWVVNERLVNISLTPYNVLPEDVKEPSHQTNNHDTNKENVQNLCVICKENASRYAPNPCGHLCMCLECTRTLESQWMQNCPVCRVHIIEMKPIYIC